jgi:Castor and Pollux, part of voltage-gated ion channel
MHVEQLDVATSKLELPRQLLLACFRASTDTKDCCSPSGSFSHDMLSTCMQDEFYLREWPSLAGRRFADALLMFQHAMPVGVRPLATGEVLLNPADDYVLAPGEHRQMLVGPADCLSPLLKPVNREFHCTHGPQQQACCQAVGRHNTLYIATNSKPNAIPLMRTNSWRSCMCRG